MKANRAHLDQMEIIERIRAKKRELGKQLIILTHHYQRKEIVELGDFVGDSFELSRRAAADKDCRYIVFCGVHFMAESAAILAQPYQVVQIPEVEAGCWMAGMAEADSVQSAWDQIESVAGKDSTIPVVYMNSDAELKSFCGNRGGRDRPPRSRQRRLLAGRPADRAAVCGRAGKVVSDRSLTWGV